MAPADPLPYETVCDVHGHLSMNSNLAVDKILANLGLPRQAKSKLQRLKRTLLDKRKGGSSQQQFRLVISCLLENDPSYKHLDISHPWVRPLLLTGETAVVEDNVDIQNLVLNAESMEQLENILGSEQQEEENGGSGQFHQRPQLIAENGDDDDDDDDNSFQSALVSLTRDGDESSESSLLSSARDGDESLVSSASDGNESSLARDHDESSFSLTRDGDDSSESPLGSLARDGDESLVSSAKSLMMSKGKQERRNKSAENGGSPTAAKNDRVVKGTFVDYIFLLIRIF
jgi:hypothetical protein